MENQDTGKFVYIGTYTIALPHILGDQLSKGIHTFKLNQDGSLTHVGESEPTHCPTFLTTSPDGKFLYSSSEIGPHFCPGQETGTVTSWSIDSNSGLLTQINKVNTGGMYSCAVGINKAGDRVVCANYIGGTVAIFNVNKDGSLSEATCIYDCLPKDGADCSELAKTIKHGPNEARQEASHPHMSIFAPDDDNSIFVPDLGCDCVHQFKVGEGDQLVLDKVCHINKQPGQGPRHMAVHTSHKFAYVLTELGNTIVVFNYAAGQIEGDELQNISTLPDGWTGVQPICKTVKDSHGADVHISADGKFLYASNRGHESIVIFSIDQATGLLTLVGHEDIVGSIPRSFGITPEGDFLLVACQDTHTINSFKIDKETGKLTNTGHKAACPSPVKVHFNWK